MIGVCDEIIAAISNFLHTHYSRVYVFGGTIIVVDADKSVSCRLLITNTGINSDDGNGTVCFDSPTFFHDLKCLVHGLR